jgi:hypothetical protein
MKELTVLLDKEKFYEDYGDIEIFVIHIDDSVEKLEDIKSLQVLVEQEKHKYKNKYDIDCYIIKKEGKVYANLFPRIYSA